MRKLFFTSLILAVFFAGCNYTKQPKPQPKEEDYMCLHKTLKALG